MHPFFALRDQLPSLAFGSSADKATDSPLLSDYLKFYQLDFPAEICSYYRIGTFDSGPYTLVGQCWFPAGETKGTILVLHGYFDHVGLYAHLIRYLLAMNYVVFAYDQPGHGLSNGERVSINDFSEYSCIFDRAIALIESLPSPLSFIGQSTGCAVILHNLFINRADHHFYRIIMLAPLLRPSSWNLLRWIYYMARPFVDKMPRRVAKNSNDPDFVRFVHFSDPLQTKYYKLKWVTAMNRYYKKLIHLKPIHTISPLIVQGRRDTTVDWKFNMTHLKRLIPNANVFYLQEGRHHLVNERPDLRNQVFRQIRDFLLASSQKKSD
jgi:lysophospholipase